MTAETPDTRHLSSIPAPGTPSFPAPPKTNPYPRNPLLDFKYGPDPEGLCPACRWVKAHVMRVPFCPHHLLFHDHTVVPLAPDAGDATGAFLAHATTTPVYQRGDKVWFLGLLPCEVETRYWGKDGRWRYLAVASRGGAEVNGHQALFAPAHDPGWHR